ncbi:hypothetical protein Leryth_022969 [Lithospermum erythrorhizon]|nr:hypothetical protein Leryth_022969 [Lithospermum erythrorhizon]
MGLTKDESWELLHQKLSNKGGIPKNLLSIAKEISDSCKGLPLSIVVTAGILSEIEASEHKWNQIAESIVSHILDDVHSQCKAILELSYSHLPDHLQSCFLYFGVFPEDMEISVSQLITLWSAEGFVQDYETNSLEDVAKKYVVDLITRSLVIFSKERSLGGVKTCRVHDLLHEFCKQKTKENYFLTVLDEKNCALPSHDSHRFSFQCKLHKITHPLSSANIASMFFFWRQMVQTLIKYLIHVIRWACWIYEIPLVLLHAYHVWIN